jgi:spore cortex biosynthesis protein YabQ
VISLAVQLYTFLVVVLTGIALSFCFDLYHAWRALVRLRGIWGDAADLGFGVFGAALVAVGLFLSNWGELRLYVFLGLALGATIYHALASPVVQWAARWALRAGARWLGRAWRVATWPLRLAGRLAGGVGRAGAAAVRVAHRGGGVTVRRGASAVRRALVWLSRRFPFVGGAR